MLILAGKTGFFARLAFKAGQVRINYGACNAKREKRGRRFSGLISLGCPKNMVDSERLMGEMAMLDWEFTSDEMEADCLVVNTCGFIADACLESREALEEIIEVKKKNPEVILWRRDVFHSDFPDR